MHCNKNGFISQIVATILPFIQDEYLEQCDSHIQHHMDVEPDMSLKDGIDEKSLFMSWRVYLFFLFIFIISFFISKWITKYDISYKYIIVIGVIITFIYEYLWNKTHAKMHNYEKDYSILQGPYDQNLFDLDPIKNQLYMNHVYHHMQKGDKKGNYNIIILGADEWFGYNNKTIDNKEYCKSSPHEKICK
jgi:hypothetical protein